MDEMCDISLIDIQACNCGRPEYYSELGYSTCVAYGFANNPHVGDVYAWTGTSSFFDFGYNCSLDGRYVHFYAEQGGYRIMWV